MTWRWTRPTEPDEREEVEARCWVAGALGVWEQPDAIVAWFDAPTDAVPPGGQWSEELEQDWMAAWRTTVQPLILGSFAILPTWQADGWEPPPGIDHVLVLDQGHGFGTGHHATTAGCLEEVVRHTRAGMRVIDVGCGSAILAIAAAMLGATPVVAVDLDEEAVIAARRNVADNGVDVDVRVGSFEVAGPPADLVLANLLTDTIVALAKALADLTLPGGVLVVSGITEERRERPLRALADAGMVLTSSRTQDGWLVAVLSRPDDPSEGRGPA